MISATYALYGAQNPQPWFQTNCRPSAIRMARRQPHAILVAHEGDNVVGSVNLAHAAVVSRLGARAAPEWLSRQRSMHGLVDLPAFHTLAEWVANHRY